MCHRERSTSCRLRGGSGSLRISLGHGKSFLVELRVRLGSSLHSGRQDRRCGPGIRYRVMGCHRADQVLVREPESSRLSILSRWDSSSSHCMRHHQRVNVRYLHPFASNPERLYQPRVGLSRLRGSAESSSTEASMRQRSARHLRAQLRLEWIQESAEECITALIRSRHFGLWLRR
jgi:hypothetical protein